MSEKEDKGKGRDGKDVTVPLLVPLTARKAVRKIHVSPNEKFYVLLHIAGGCWNTDLFQLGSRNLFANIGEEPTEDDKTMIKFTEERGAFNSEINKKFEINPDQFLKSSLFITLKEPDELITEDTDPGKIGIKLNKELHEMAYAMNKKQQNWNFTQYWRAVPWKWLGQDPPSFKKKPETHLQAKHIPLLFKNYVQLDDIGWIDIHVTMFKVKKDDFVYRIYPNPWQKIELPDYENKQFKDILPLLKDPSILPNSKPDFISMELDASETSPKNKVIKIKDHKHNLELPQSHDKNVNYTCDNCSNNRQALGLYKCPSCDYKICMKCTSNQNVKVIKPIKTPEEHVDKFVCLKIAENSESKEKIGLNLWINDIHIVAMIFRNMYSDQSDDVKFCSEIFSCLTAEVYVEAFKMWLGIDWHQSIESCVEILSIIKTRIWQHQVGNWIQVETECNEIVRILLDYLPSVKKDQKYYNEIGTTFKNLWNKIVDYELKEITAHPSVVSLVQDGLWHRRNIGLYPLPFWISPNFNWIMRSIMFFIFLGLLTYDVYIYSHALDSAIKSKVTIVLNWNQFDNQVVDIPSYISWFESTIPALYDIPVKHTLLLAGDMLLRQIRLDPVKCVSLNPSLIQNVPLCYPRLINLDDTWNPDPTWDNSSLSDTGRDGIVSQFSQLSYPSNAYTIPISLNKTVGLQTIQGLNLSVWLDWSTQAVILESIFYSPNSRLYGISVTVAEFTNLGTFYGSHDTIIVDETEMVKLYTWIDIVLILFFAGFALEEGWDFIISGCIGATTTKRQTMKIKKFLKILKPFYLYIYDFWNCLDILMISTGIASLYMRFYAALQLKNYNMQEIWLFSSRQQVSQILGAFCIVTSWIRSLHVFLPSKFLGVMILTIIKMIDRFVRFIVLIGIIGFAFSASFYLLYSESIYSGLSLSLLNTFSTTFTGYQFPAYNNVIGFDTPRMAIVFQILYIFIAIVLLLNLLIALLSETYTYMVEKAEVEYNWTLATSIRNAHGLLWPAPFNIIQVVATVMLWLPVSCFDIDGLLYPDAMKKYKESIPSGLKTNRMDLCSGMTIYFFKLLLKEDYYEHVKADKVEENNKQVVEIDDLLLTRREKQDKKWDSAAAKKILGDIEDKEQTFYLKEDTDKPIIVKLTLNEGSIKGDGSDTVGPYQWSGIYSIGKVNSIKEDIHIHELILTDKPLKYHLCDTCGEKIPSYAYRCGECDHDCCFACVKKNNFTITTKECASLKLEKQYIEKYTVTYEGRHYATENKDKILFSGLIITAGKQSGNFQLSNEDIGVEKQKKWFEFDLKKKQERIGQEMKEIKKNFEESEELKSKDKSSEEEPQTGRRKEIRSEIEQ